MTRLFHVPLSPFCRKVRLTLAEKRIEVELVEERYWEQGPEFLRRNPAGKIPVIRLNGRTMSESQAICEYLDETVPEPRLMPRDPEGRYEVRRLCAWFDDKFHAEVTSKLLYERVNKKVMKLGYPDSKNVKSGSARIKYHLDYLSWLLDQRRWPHLHLQAPAGGALPQRRTLPGRRLRGRLGTLPARRLRRPQHPRLAEDHRGHGAGPRNPGRHDQRTLRPVPLDRRHHLPLPALRHGGDWLGQFANRPSAVSICADPESVCALEFEQVADLIKHIGNLSIGGHEELLAQNVPTAPPS